MKQKVPALTGCAREPVFHATGPRNNKQSVRSLPLHYTKLIYRYKKAEDACSQGSPAS